MNYERIYREFIVDRRDKEAHLVGYSERHHITPKSMGGNDDAANLINLTAEDHYFAHLLLAKWLGGAQWGGVHCMSGVSNKATDRRKLFSARYMVGIARRKFAKHKSAQMTGQRREFRDQVATLMHEDGRTVQGSRTQLAEATGLNLASISRICTGKQARSYCGWFADKQASDRAKARRAALGRQQSRAGANKLQVRRAECGTVYASLTHAASAYLTHTSNIARAIRNNGRAGGSRWSYHDGQAHRPSAKAQASSY